MQKSKLPSLITILILTLITALMWIGFTIYRAFTTTPEPSVAKEISQPLTPTLDTVTLNKVESALFFSGSQIPQVTFSASASASPAVIPKPTPVATPIASPSSSPVETSTPSATPVVP